MDNLEISGTSLTIDLSGFGPDLLGDYDFFSFTFSEGNSTATFNLADLAVTAVNGDQTYTGYSETQDGATTLYFGNPEQHRQPVPLQRGTCCSVCRSPPRRRSACCPWQFSPSAAAGLNWSFFTTRLLMSMAGS